MNREKAERYVKLGLSGAVLTLIGDCLIGAAKFPDGADLIEGYFAIALDYILITKTQFSSTISRRPKAAPVTTALATTGKSSSCRF